MNIAVEEKNEANPPAADSPALAADNVPVGAPLAWPIVDDDGTLLFATGAMLASPEERDFLFQHFRPQRGDLLDPATQSVPAGEQAADPTTPLTLKDMHLEIGALIGMRPQLGSAAPMLPCRIIGFAPNQAVFVTPPLHEGRMLPLRLGENIEIVAIASQAVYRFVCTVEAVCRTPFDYVVLSKPGIIRRLRERKSIRVRTHLAVRFGLGETGQSYEGLGCAKGISTHGMSLSAPWPLGAVGERLRVAFRLKSADLDTPIETSAIIRNVQNGHAEGVPTQHGLEFDRLDPTQQMALKVYVFDRHDEVLYWSTGLK